MRHLDPMDWYPWYWQVARSDRRWQRLSWHVRGALREIFDECWKEGCVSNEPAALAEIVGCSRRELDEMLPAMMTLLYEIHPGLLSNRKLEKMRTRKDAERIVRAEAGRQGGRSKANAQMELLASAKQMTREEKRREEERREELKQGGASAEVVQDDPSPGDNEQIVIERWNMLCDKTGFHRMVSYNPTRRRALRARLRERGWFSRLDAALRFLGSSRWHQENPISFDTFIRPGKVDHYAERAETDLKPHAARSRDGARSELDGGIFDDLNRGGGRARLDA